jgi:hypothetical protein
VRGHAGGDWEGGAQGEEADADEAAALNKADSYQVKDPTSTSIEYGRLIPQVLRWESHPLTLALAFALALTSNEAGAHLKHGVFHLSRTRAAPAHAPAGTAVRSVEVEVGSFTLPAGDCASVKDPPLKD